MESTGLPIVVDDAAEEAEDEADADSMLVVLRKSISSSRILRAKSFTSLSLMAFVMRDRWSVIFASSASMSFLFCLFIAWISASCLFTMSLSLFCFCS